MANRTQDNIRPLKFTDFNGQPEVTQHLKAYIAGSIRRKEVLDHTIFYGPPGLGKTTLAGIVANELGVKFKATTAPVLSRTSDCASILTQLGINDVLFIDEIHRLRPEVEEMLYSAMEDFKIDLMIGEGLNARTVRINLAPFTLIGATTRMGLISSPLRDRFGIPERLRFYSVDELTKVVYRASQAMQFPVGESCCQLIGQRSRGTPRIALRILRRVRDLAHDDVITPTIINSALDVLEIDVAGLDSGDIRYLRYIYDNYQNAAVGLNTIAAGIGEKQDAIEDMIEPYLLQAGFIKRTAQGRMLTDKGKEHLNNHHYAKE